MNRTKNRSYNFKDWHILRYAVPRKGETFYSSLFNEILVADRNEISGKRLILERIGKTRTSRK